MFGKLRSLGSSVLSGAAGSISHGGVQGLHGYIQKNENSLASSLRQIFRKALDGTSSQELSDLKAKLVSLEAAHSAKDVAELSQAIKKVQDLLKDSLKPDEQKTLTTFDALLHTPIKKMTKEEFLRAFRETHTLTDRLIQEQQGVIQSLEPALLGIADKAGDLIVSKVKTLPKQIMEGMSDPSSPSPPSTEKKEGSNAFLSKVGGLLNLVKDSIGSAFSEKAICWLSTVMEFAFNLVKTNLEKDHYHPFVQKEITPLLEQIVRLREQGSWTELHKTLIACKKVMENHLTLFQGIRLPFNSKPKTRVSAIPDFLSNIDQHQRVLRKEPEDPPQAITQEMIQHESLKLKTRATVFPAIKWITEGICGMEASETFIAELLEIPSQMPSAQWEEIFRTRFFDKIDASELFVLRKWLAKGTYYILHPVMNFFVKGFYDQVMHHIEEWKTQEDPLHPRDLGLIDRFRNWLAILSSSYNQAAFTRPKKSEDLKQMLGKALQNPKHNHGLKSQEVYAAFAQTAVDLFGPRFIWRKSVSRYLDQHLAPASPSPLINTAIESAQTVIRCLLDLLLMAPEWLCNTLLHSSTKLFLRYNSALEKQIERSILSFSHPTPSAYSLNQVIFKELQKVRDVIRIHFSEQNTDQNNNRPTPSKTKKRELSNLIEYLIEVLNKSRYNTQDKLKRYLNGDLSLPESAMASIESFLLPQALETAASTIFTAVDALSYDELTYQALTLANKAFSPTEPVSEKEFIVLESGISELISQILESAIFYALNNAFDFEGKKQKKMINIFFTDFKKEISTFTTQVNRLIRTKPYQFAKQATELSIALQKQQLERQSTTDGNPDFHTETKQQLNTISSECARLCKELGIHLNEATHLQKANSSAEKGQSALEQCLEQATRFVNYLSQHTYHRNTLPASLIALKKFSVAIDAYEKYTHSKSLLTKLKKFKESITKQLEEIQAKHREIESIYMIQGAFDRSIVYKKGHLPVSMHLPPTQIQGISQLISQLPYNRDREHYQKILKRLIEARNQFSTRDTESFLHQSVQKMLSQKLQNLAWDHSSMRTSIGEFSLDARNGKQKAAIKIQINKNKIKTKIREIQHHLASLKKWGEELHEMPILSFLPFDMEWISDISKQIASDLANQKIQELRAALSKEHNYDSAIKQLFIFPFLEHYGKHHLKGQK